MSSIKKLVIQDICNSSKIFILTPHLPDLFQSVGVGEF